MTTARLEYRDLFQEWHTLVAEIDTSGHGMRHPEYRKYLNITKRLAKLYLIVGDDFDEQCAQELGLRGDNGELSMVQEEKPLAACGGM